jgi:hypothetical protein
MAYASLFFCLIHTAIVIAFNYIKVETFIFAVVSCQSNPLSTTTERRLPINLASTALSRSSNGRALIMGNHQLPGL